MHERRVLQEPRPSIHPCSSVHFRLPGSERLGIRSRLSRTRLSSGRRAARADCKPQSRSLCGCEVPCGGTLPCFGVFQPRWAIGHTPPGSSSARVRPFASPHRSSNHLPSALPGWRRSQRQAIRTSVARIRPCRCPDHARPRREARGVGARPIRLASSRLFANLRQNASLTGIVASFGPIPFNSVSSAVLAEARSCASGARIILLAPTRSVLPVVPCGSPAGSTDPEPSFRTRSLPGGEPAQTPRNRLHGSRQPAPGIQTCRRRLRDASRSTRSRPACRKASTREGRLCLNPAPSPRQPGSFRRVRWQHGAWHPPK